MREAQTLPFGDPMARRPVPRPAAAAHVPTTSFSISGRTTLPSTPITQSDRRRSSHPETARHTRSLHRTHRLCTHPSPVPSSRRSKLLIGWLCLATTAVILAPALAGPVEETERFQIERMVDTTSVEGETESERDDFCHAECQATEGCEFWVRSDSTCFHMRDEEGFEEDAMLRKGVKYVDRFHDSQVRPACPRATGARRARASWRAAAPELSALGTKTQTERRAPRAPCIARGAGAPPAM